MSNKPQMVPGFNHNIKHRGQIFHIQTEDSGAANPHIITHLFVGGNILATKKTSYADIVHADNLHDIVRELMQEQHKAMLRNLINGVYDDVANGSGVALEQVATEPPPPVGATAKAPPAAGQKLESGKFPVPGAAASMRPAQPVASQPPTGADRPTATAPTATAAPVGFSRPITGTQIHRPPAPERVPPSTKPAAPKVILRPAAEVEAESPAQPAVAQPAVAQPAVAQPARAANPGQAARVGDDPRLPPEVLAARRLAEKPKPKDTSGPTIFGENLISEKSLDEVILGYLAGNEEGGS